MAYDILGLACRGKGGVPFGDLEDLRRQARDTFQSVLVDLEADGYVSRKGHRLTFRSNLLRAWWSRHHGRDGVR